jgi:hypothetical protein
VLISIMWRFCDNNIGDFSNRCYVWWFLCKCILSKKCQFFDITFVKNIYKITTYICR